MGMKFLDCSPESKMKCVIEAVSTRKKQVKTRSLFKINEHFEPAFNAVMATQVAFHAACKLASMKH